MLAPIILAAALATWPAPLRDAVAAAHTSAAAFTAQVKSGPVQMTVEYNPTRVERWLVKYPSGRRVNKDEKAALEAFKRSKPERDYSCAARTQLIPADVTLKAETADEYVYLYKPKATDETPKQTAAALKYALGEVRVSKDTGQLLGGRIWTTTAFKPAPIAKLNSYAESYECGPSGWITHSLLKMDYSVLGKSDALSRDLVLSDIRALR
jgi:hypothetical protein